MRNIFRTTLLAIAGITISVVNLQSANACVIDQGCGCGPCPPYNDGPSSYMPSPSSPPSGHGSSVTYPTVATVTPSQCGPGTVYRLIPRGAHVRDLSSGTCIPVDCKTTQVTTNGQIICTAE